MSFRSINVIIKPRHFFPWITQKIQVDGQEAFTVKRHYGLFSLSTTVCSQSTKQIEIKITQPLLYRSVFEVAMDDRTYKIRKISYWQWECRCDEEVILINRLGGIKCVLSQDGRQLAIMSLNTNLPFVQDKNTYIRVNSDEYLHLSIAAGLLVSGFGLNINPLFLNNSKLSPMRPVEIA